MPHRHLIVRLAAIALVAAVAVVGLVAAAGADPKKPYTVVVESPKPGGATDTAYTVTLTNKAGPQKLGSANLTVPAALTIVGEPATDRGTVTREGNVLKLRDLELRNDESVTVTLGLQMPCAPGDYPWGVQAKQSNDFRGTGNDMGPVSGTLSTKVEGGGCRLRFVAQPADAERDTRIRADAFRPASPSLVSVEAVDGNGNRVASFTGRIELRLVQSGPGSLTSEPSNAVAGLATFSNLSIDQSGEYNLQATTTVSGFAPAVSNEFKIIDVVEPCTASSCTATLAGTNTTTTVTGTGGSGTGFVLLSLNLGRQPVCAGYTQATSDWYEYETTVSRDKTVTATFSKAAMAAFGKPASKLQICFAAPRSFPAKDGPAKPFDYDGDPVNGAEGFVGLLPDCPYKPKTPCILKREGSDHHRGGSGGGASVKYLVPAAWGDPRHW